MKASTISQILRWIPSRSRPPIRQSSNAAAASMDRRFVPRRAMVYVPASIDKMMAKVPKLNADCVVLECEDGVALTSKAKARENAVQFLNGLNPSSSSELACFELGLRVNSVSSGLLEEDLAALGTAKQLPQGLMLPKVDSISDLFKFSELWKKHVGTERRSFDNQPINLVIWIESARALINMAEILELGCKLRSTRSSKTGSGIEENNIQLDACVFGSDDFRADIGAERTAGESELMFARQQFVTFCKAFRLQAIDSVYIDVKNLDDLERSSREGAAWGFTGKQVIHPSQIPIVQSAFLPAPDRVDWARELLHEYKQHSERGSGAFTFRGHMIDAPLVLQARNIVSLIDSIPSASSHISTPVSSSSEKNHPSSASS